MIKRIQEHYGNELTISAAIVIAITHECERIEALKRKRKPKPAPTPPAP